ncbi:MAG: c-type cytochrome biogenesis protein CcmI [Burkholderiales bacterium]
MGFSPLFWAFAFALLAATLAFLLPPLLRRNVAVEAPADASAVTAVFRDHKRQIEEEFAARTITAEERDAALAELTQRFGQELPKEAAAQTRHGGHSRFVAAVVIAAIVPAVAGGLYYTLGNPTAMSPVASAPHGTAAGMDDPQMQQAVAALAERLKANPEDGQGWYILGRSYRVMGRMDAAIMAYSEASKRLPKDPAVYTDWAEAVAQAQGKTLAGQPIELLDRALALDPNFPKALALRGSAAAEAGDNAKAIALWQKLRAQLPPDDPNLPDVDAALARVGGAPPAATAAAPAAAAIAAAKPAPAAAPAKGGNDAGTAGGGSLEGRVEIDPKLAKSAGPDDTVFLFARAAEGPRMPLAVLRFKASELPKSFTLTDAMAMTPAATISKAGKVVVEARISKSGDVAARPGDLSGASGVIEPGARNVRVTIDKVLP